MSAISLSRFRRNPIKLLEEVAESDESLTVTRANGRDVVIVPARELDALRETLHLLRSPKNAKRLRTSLRQIKTGKVIEIPIP